MIAFLLREGIIDSQMVTLEQLAVAKDRKDKVLSRVHKKRIELDFRDRSPHSENAIHCCKHCCNLFSEKVYCKWQGKNALLHVTYDNIR